MPRAEYYEIDLEANKPLDDGVMLKGHITYKGVNEKEVVGWLKQSQYPSSLYYFFINESIPQGGDRSSAIKYTVKPVSVKSGQYGLFADGAMVQIGELKFPVTGQIEVGDVTTKISLKLAKERTIDYYRDKGHEYNFGEDEQTHVDSQDENVPF